jgi:predicted ferric reductase
VTAQLDVVAEPLRPPRPPALRAGEVGMIALVLIAVVVFIWSKHGGVAALGESWAMTWSSLTQLTGLLTSLCGLLGLVLIARPVTVERNVGLDRMFVWHRYLGESMAVLLAAHIATAIVAESSGGGSVWAAVRDYTGRDPYMAVTAVGSLLVFVVTITSLRSIRRLMSFETWYFVHLLAYAGLALTFSHEIVLGTDFYDDALTRWLWIAFHVAVLALVLSGRWGRVLRSVVRPLRVESVVSLGHDITAVTLGGPALRDVEAHAGQFCMLRPLRPRMWWQSHPFSLSAAPNHGGLRFTVKDRGDASSAIMRLPVGARVAVEGPYGVATPDAAIGRKVLCIVGGVGVAPARAMLELLTPDQEPIVIYRAHSHDDLVHLDEMRDIAHSIRGEVLTIVGPSIALATKDPFSAHALLRAVPDITERVVYVCGPDSLVHAARRGLKDAHVPFEDVHFEMVWW